MYIIIIALVFILWGLIYSLKLEINKINIHSNKISGKYKIAQISDLHSKMSRRNFTKMLDAIHDIDYIFLTGDIFDDKGEYELCVKFLEAIKDKKVYYITGNHEHRRSDLEEIINLLKSFSVNLLNKNSPQKLSEINIYGVDDILNNDEFFETLSDYDKKIDKSKFNILLSHRPEYADYYLNYDLIFTGHFHGGHVRLPFLGGIVGPGLKILIGKRYYQKGLYKLNENSKIYVNVGATSKLYLGIPRFFNPTEILIVEIDGDEK